MSQDIVLRVEEADCECKVVVLCDDMGEYVIGPGDEVIHEEDGTRGYVARVIESRTAHEDSYTVTILVAWETGKASEVPLEVVRIP